MKRKFAVSIILFSNLAPMIFIAILMLGCGKDSPVNNESNIPSEYRGRLVEDQGTITVQSREVTFRVWDHGRVVDGDIITLIVNDQVLLDTFELKGPDAKQQVAVTLEFTGYNYLLLFAHNVGSIPPNTVGLSIHDGMTEQSFELEANLSTNGAYNIVVE